MTKLVFLMNYLAYQVSEVAFLISAIYTYPLYGVLTVSSPTDVTRFIEHLDGDVLAERLGKVFSNAAVDKPKKKTKVSIDLTVGTSAPVV